MYEKISVTRHGVKTTSMTKMNVKSGKKQKKSSNTRSEEERKERYYYNQKRKRDKIIEAIEMNFKEYSSCFVTLTFTDSSIDYKAAGKKFENLIKEIRRAYDNFKYVATIEFQDRGAIHYHLVCNITDENDAAGLIHHYWGNDGINIKRVYYITGLAVYMTKEFIHQDNSSPLFGKRCYKASQNLEKPLVINSWSIQQEKFKTTKNELTKGKLKKKVIIEHEKVGTIEYNTYNSCIYNECLFGDYVLATRKLQF